MSIGNEIKGLLWWNLGQTRILEYFGVMDKIKRRSKR